ncbi:MAG: TIGR00282 family metallophosphoesterase [Verrucomicrobiae bacterium]|nr:TIGR00282 family metallophosphoesterase [Verrucomicrobiae bacterium]
MKILFIGDIVGRAGREAVKKRVSVWVKERQIDTVIANGENAAGGSGITAATAEDIFRSGVHVITLGDHTWDQRELPQYIEKEARLVRPANYPEGVPGQGWGVFEISGFCPPIGVLNLQGRTFMDPIDDPFRVASQLVPVLKGKTPVIFVDFHAEATSEKIAMGRFLDGKVSAVVGTHTHVQTADEQIFPGGTAFLCDVGFTGAHESVIGRRIEPVLKRFVTGLPQRFEVADEDVRFSAVLINVDDTTGKCTAIERIFEKLES